VLYVDNAGRAIPSNRTVTVAEAADDLVAFRNSARDSAARSISSQFAAAIDEMRADMLHGGVKPAAPQAAAPVQIEQVPGLEPDVAQALALPAIREAIESELSATAQTRVAYSQGLDNAMAFSREALHELVPELANIPLEHFQGAMAQLARVDPQRHGAVVRLLDRVLHIQAAKMAEEAHAQQGRESWRVAENTRFERMVGPRSPEFGVEMVEYAQQLGVGRNQLEHLLRTEPVLQSAAFQKVIYDAVQLRIAQKRAAGGWKNNKARAPIPPVQKPGTSTSPRERSSADAQALNARLNQSGSLADAFALLKSKRR